LVGAAETGSVGFTAGQRSGGSDAGKGVVRGFSGHARLDATAIRARAAAED